MSNLFLLSRRRATQILLASGAAAALAGCGFRLRGSYARPAFSRLRIEGAMTSAVKKDLGEVLARSGVTLIDERTPADPAATQPDVVLTVLQDQRERAVVGSTSTGQVCELQLRHRIKFRVRSASGRDLIADAELLQERDLSFSETNVLGKAEEEALLFDNMRTRLVEQLMLRLSRIAQ